MRGAALILLLLAAGPALAADKLGKRTAPPEQSMAGIGAGSSDAALEEAIAAAAAFPLGTKENPVRAAGPEGERAYVARLRCADGRAPQAGAPRPGGVGAYGTIVDLVPLDCGAAAPGRFDLIVDLYHEGYSENRAPAGFSVAGR